MPCRQTTFVYKFTPSDQFDPRDIGLVININYVDDVESSFRDAVFNDTVFITDPITPVNYMEMVVYSSGTVPHYPTPTHPPVYPSAAIAVYRVRALPLAIVAC
jgi:hypothetical protein